MIETYKIVVEHRNTGRPQEATLETLAKEYGIRFLWEGNGKSNKDYTHVRRDISLVEMDKLISGLKKIFGEDNVNFEKSSVKYLSTYKI